MKKLRLFSRPTKHIGALTLSTFSKDGLTTFHMSFGKRRFGLAIYGDKVTPTMVVMALQAFTRTMRKEFLSGQTHQQQD